jgi:hypothetical protein
MCRPSIDPSFRECTPPRETQKITGNERNGEMLRKQRLQSAKRMPSRTSESNGAKLKKVKVINDGGK